MSSSRRSFCFSLRCCCSTAITSDSEWCVSLSNRHKILHSSSKASSNAVTGTNEHKNGYFTWGKFNIMSHTRLLFSSGRPYVTQRGNTLSWPEKQHGFVWWLYIFSGWISQTASISIYLSHGFCIRGKKICQGSCGLLQNSLWCFSVCWWNKEWWLFAEGRVIIDPQLWSIFDVSLNSITFFE